MSIIDLKRVEIKWRLKIGNSQSGIRVKCRGKLFFENFPGAR